MQMRHPSDRDMIAPEKMGEPSFLAGREVAIKTRQRNGVGQAVAPHVGDAQPIERSMPCQPGGQRLIASRREHDRQRLRTVVHESMQTAWRSNQAATPVSL